MLNILCQPLAVKDISVVQYERADYGVGTEEHLHWAIVLLPSGGKTKGRSFQVIDRHYQDERGVQRNLYDLDEDLRRNKRCLDGVRIGSVRKNDYEALCKALCLL